jgi:uroporphyrinogen-III synthase
MSWLVVVTRPKSAGQAGVPSSIKRWAQVIWAPVIRTRPLSSQRLKKALARIGRYEGVLFTSVPAVEHFLAALRRARLAPREMTGLKIGVVGPVTAEALKRAGLSTSLKAGLRPSLVPSEFRAERLAKEIAATPGSRWLFPQAEGGLKVLQRQLHRRKVGVDVVPVYRTEKVALSRGVVRRVSSGSSRTVVICTSPSTAIHFITQLPKGDRPGILRESRFVSIGPTTAAALRNLKVRRIHQSPSATMESVWKTVEGIIRGKR